MTGFIKSLAKFLFLICAGAAGILLLWRLLQVPGDATKLRGEVGAISTPLEIMAIVYLTTWRIKGKIGEKGFSIISSALKASAAFYVAGVAALLAGQVKFYSLIGLLGASVYLLKNSLFYGPTILPEKLVKPSSIYVRLSPSNPISEIPVSICTPPGEGVVVSYNIHLGEEATSWVGFKLNLLQSLSGALKGHIRKMAQVFGLKELRSSRMQVPDMRRHLSKCMKNGYLLDSTRSIEETLKAVSGLGRRGTEVSIQFAWVRTRKGVMARHILLASSNDARAFSRFETDLIRKLPFLNYVKAEKACKIMTRAEESNFLIPVGETYMRNVIPLDLSFELAPAAERIILKKYVEMNDGGKKPFSIPFHGGHILLVGGKSSGKTRFAKNLVKALEEMGATVLVIDLYGEYSFKESFVEKSYLNPLKPPVGVDVLTHSGSLLVFSPTLASVFDTGDPQEMLSKIVEMKEPSLERYLMEIAGKVDEESSSLRFAISKLVEETEIDEAIRELSIPPKVQGIMRVQIPVNRSKKATILLTELFLAWVASLAISKQSRRVVMVIEDAYELLNASEMPKILSYATEYGLSLVMTSRNCTEVVSTGPCFSTIVGFRMSCQQDILAFRKLVGVGGDEPEGIQVEAAIDSLQRGEGLVFIQSSFDFIKIKPLGADGGEEGID